MSSSDRRFFVNLDNPIAIYVQIENLIQFAIAAGEYKPNDILPSVRELSDALEINANTITKAYRDLELLGIVESRRGVGVRVTSQAPRICKDHTRKMVEQHLRDAVAEGMACGFKEAEIQKIVNQTLRAQLRPYTAG